MAIVLTVINQKGGVGKSTSVNAMGAWLHQHGKKVLYVDLDPQKNLTTSINFEAQDQTAFEVLCNLTSIESAIVKTEQGDLIPGSTNLATIEVVLKDTIGREYRLKEALESVKEKYDYIVIDTPPALATLSINAMVASDRLIIPTQAEMFSLMGIGQLKENIEMVKKYCNANLEIEGIFITQYNSRTVVSRNMLATLGDMAEEIGTKLFDTKIRECVALKESQLSKKDIFHYAPNSNAAEDYGNLYAEIFTEVR